MSLIEREINDSEYIENYASLRLLQLRRLLNRSLDKNVSWKRVVAVKTSFFDAHTYKTQEVDVNFRLDEMERIRKYAIFTIICDLDSLGYGEEARVMLHLTTAPKTEPTIW